MKRVRIHKTVDLQPPKRKKKSVKTRIDIGSIVYLPKMNRIGRVLNTWQVKPSKWYGVQRTEDWAYVELLWGVQLPVHYTPGPVTRQFKELVGPFQSPEEIGRILRKALK